MSQTCLNDYKRNYTYSILRVCIEPRGAQLQIDAVLIGYLILELLEIGDK